MQPCTIEAFSRAAVLSGNPASVHHAGQSARRLWEHGTAAVQRFVAPESGNVLWLGSRFEGTLMALASLEGPAAGDGCKNSNDVLWLGAPAEEVAPMAEALEHLGLRLQARTLADLFCEQRLACAPNGPWRRILVDGVVGAGFLGPWRRNSPWAAALRQTPWVLRLGALAPLWPAVSSEAACAPCGVLLDGSDVGAPAASCVLALSEGCTIGPLWSGGGQQDGLRPGTVAKETAVAVAAALGALIEPAAYEAMAAMRNDLELWAQADAGYVICTPMLERGRLAHHAILHGGPHDPKALQQALWGLRIHVGRNLCACGAEALVVALHPGAEVAPLQVCQRLRQALSGLCKTDNSCALTSP